MIAWLVVAVLAASAAAWVLAPLFRDDAASAERIASVLSEAEDLESQRGMALTALRDLEDDRATGKIGDADYDDLKSRLTARAAEILRRIDALAPPSESRRG